MASVSRRPGSGAVSLGAGGPILATRSRVRRRGKARIRTERDAVLIAIPMGNRIHSDMCHGLGPKPMTITLPKPLGDRALYDVGSLPIRQVEVHD